MAFGVLVVSIAFLAHATAVAPPQPFPPTPPANGVQNGDFETGLSGWSIPLVGSPISVVPADGGHALSVPAIVPSTHSNGNWVEQRAPTSSLPFLAFQVRAYISGEAARPGIQVVEAVSHWDPRGTCLPGGCQFMAAFGLSKTTVGGSIMNGARGASAATPSLNAWHTYTLVFAPDLAVGAFLIDGIPVGPVQGVLGYNESAEWLLAGDGAQGAGQAPDAMFDDVYYGAAATLPSA
ncbi:MAG: hypothetical protein ACYDCK_11250 [Thermoplasmatota archaeon]